MKLLGHLLELELKRFFSTAVVPCVGDLFWNGHDLVLRVDAATREQLRDFRDWSVVSLVYQTDRFESRRSEFARRPDQRPHQHCFCRRPALDLVSGQGEFGEFRLAGVRMEFNAVGEPTYIAS